VFLVPHIGFEFPIFWMIFVLNHLSWSEEPNIRDTFLELVPHSNFVASKISGDFVLVVEFEV